jgi:hypothetical protein
VALDYLGKRLARELPARRAPEVFVELDRHRGTVTPEPRPILRDASQSLLVTPTAQLAQHHHQPGYGDCDRSQEDQ